jgi:hypothetical protein
MTSKARCTGKLRQHLVDVLKAEPNEYPGESTAGSRGNCPRSPNRHLDALKAAAFGPQGKGFSKLCRIQAPLGIWKVQKVAVTERIACGM